MGDRAQTFYIGEERWLTNKERGLCICGGQPRKPLRRYCSYKCRSRFNNSFLVWSVLRYNFLKKHGRYCDSCGKTEAEVLKENPCGWAYDVFEVDHKVAVVNGGHPYANKNLQVLCKPCHGRKTGKDMRVWRGRKGNKTMETYV